MLQFRGSWFFWWLLSGLCIFVVLLFLGIPGYHLVLKPNIIKDKDSVVEDSFSLSQTQNAMEEIYSLIKSQYYNTWDIDETTMSRQAISSFVSGLGDPFSSYLPPIQAQELEDNINGDESIEWIGAVLSQTERWIMIEEVVKSSPAAQVGLMPLDTIVKVNGTWVQSQNVHEVVQEIRGPKGTTVDLTITRINQSWSLEIIDKTLTRDTILIPSVSSKVINWTWWTKIGYIALSVFAVDTDSHLKKEIKDLLNQNIQGIILDVRGNGGGLLPESVSVISHFLKQKSIVTKVKYRIYKDTEYKAEWGDTLSHLPLVVLINGYSASASEIIALAIRENRCPWSIDLTLAQEGTGAVLSSKCTAILVGEKTFGKGTVQSLQNLAFWWSLKLTVWKWFSPSGLSINEIGILPDYSIPIDIEEYYKNGIDPQLEKAQILLSQYLVTLR